MVQFTNKHMKTKPATSSKTAKSREMTVEKFLKPLTRAELVHLIEDDRHVIARIQEKMIANIRCQQHGDLICSECNSIATKLGLTPLPPIRANSSFSARPHGEPIL